MKKIILSIILITAISSTFAQKFKFQKITRDVKKESKKYDKEHWRPFAGAMPVSQQLNNTFNKENDVDDKGVRKIELKPIDGVIRGKIMKNVSLRKVMLCLYVHVISLLSL